MSLHLRILALAAVASLGTLTGCGGGADCCSAWAMRSCSFWIAFSGRTITLKRVICPAAFQWIMSTPLIWMPSTVQANSSTAESAPIHWPS